MSIDTQKSNGLLLWFSPDLDVVLFKKHLGELLVRLRTVKVPTEKDEQILNQIGQALGIVESAANAPAPKQLTHTLHWERRGFTVCRVSDDDGSVSPLFVLYNGSTQSDFEAADHFLDAHNRLCRILDSTPDRKTQALEAMVKIAGEIRHEIAAQRAILDGLTNPLNGIARGVNKK